MFVLFLQKKKNGAKKKSKKKKNGMYNLLPVGIIITAQSVAFTALGEVHWSDSAKLARCKRASLQSSTILTEIWSGVVITIGFINDVSIRSVAAKE